MGQQRRVGQCSMEILTVNAVNGVASFAGLSMNHACCGLLADRGLEA